MGKRKFEIGDWAVVNDKVPKKMARNIGRSGQIIRSYTLHLPFMYVLRNCPEPLYARELDKLQPASEATRGTSCVTPG